MRVARWKVEHLIEGEVLRCAVSFFRFHNLGTSEDQDAQEGGGVNWANSKFLRNKQVLWLAQLTPCA